MDFRAGLHAACWGGRGPVARFLLERGVDFSYRNEHGGDALQAVRHGSVFCQDTEGGPGTKLPEEAHPGDYAEITRCLFERGFPVPPDADFGSVSVREVLRAFGAEDRE